MKSTALILATFISGPFLARAADPLAFPGAEGFGRLTQGGNAGTVVHVTNLNDAGPGSLREAVSQPNRRVVFDVSGIIRLQSNLSASSQLTLEGQTAPGQGIAIYGRSTSFRGGHDVIAR